ncbi:MAG: hypothetical protein IH984_06300 [Planctomycetes bacterium]|nr:hypothetical protein [Planctomycetota bacterium]
MIDQRVFKIKQTRRSGFTLLELLVVTAMIILLLGILIVALNRGTRTAQSTNTHALMTSISQALVRFQGDIGYLPPVLDVDRNLSYPPDPGPGFGTIGQYVRDIQEWYSVTTLAEYLLGYGTDKQDGYGDPNPDIGALGLRDPGPDGVWGATIEGLADGTISQRNLVGGLSEGKVYGPYLELKDDHLIGSIDESGTVSLPGEGSYRPDDPKVILDYWGKPIRYYRRVYRQGGLKYPYRPDPNLGESVPTLADVFVLRPYNLDPGSATDVRPELADDNEDTTTSFELKTATFALFSRGPDRFLDQTVRFDGGDEGDFDRDGISGENEDNVVEVGQ